MKQEENISCSVTGGESCDAVFDEVLEPLPPTKKARLGFFEVMSLKQRKNLMRILIGAALFIAAMLVPVQGIWRFIAFLIPYAILGWDIIWRALRNIARGQVFDENFLMAIATIGAMALGDYPEGVAVMMFYQVGEWFQSYAVGRSRRSISELMDIRPDHANLRLEDGSLSIVSPEEVTAGQIIVIKPGERVPLDGEITEGSSSLDTSALTGESAPRDVAPGSEVISGCINLSGVITVKVNKEYGESTVARILDLVENSSSKKAQSENAITRFARWYTPLVCGAALLLAVLPPLLFSLPYNVWIYRALTFLVISCPCALVISVPLSFFGGIGGASKIGVLVKGGNYLEALAKTDTVVFDKTGTLTEGRFAVAKVAPVGISEAELLELAAYTESYSTHPIAQSVVAAYGKELSQDRVKDAGETPGHGVTAVVDGKTVLAGNAALLEKGGIAFTPANEAGTIIYIAVNGVYAGFILVADVIKPDAAKAIQSLRQAGIKKTVMLTGDNDAVGKSVAKALGLDDAYTQLLPHQKVEKVEQLLNDPNREGTLAFVGDGVNDAPVLARADVGIAMGGLGSDAAIEAADVVIMTDEPSQIAKAISISRKTLGIVNQNIIFALAVKAVVLILGALGYATMWAAVFADVGVSVLAILNAMRASRVKNLQ